jgi:hypothetical protein
VLAVPVGGGLAAVHCVVGPVGLLLEVTQFEDGLVPIELDELSDQPWCHGLSGVRHVGGKVFREGPDDAVDHDLMLGRQRAPGAVSDG